MEALWHDLIEAERQLRQAAEDLARRWREAFFSVAAVAAAADYEARLRSGTLPGSPDDAARWLTAALQTGWRAAAPENGRVLQELERLRRENARLLAEIEQLKAQAAEPLKPRPEPPQGTAAEKRPSVRPAEPPKPPSRPAPSPAPVPPPPPPQGTAAAERARAETAEEEDRLRANGGNGNGDGAPHPAALGETHPAPPLDVSELQRFLASVKPPPQFQAEFFAKDGLLVATIGYFGISSRPRLAKTLAAALGVSSKAGSLTRCFDRCARLGLIQFHKEPGAPFSLISLTDKGKEIFRRMFGYDPVPSEAEVLLRSHPGNVTHAVYCVWAREFAEVAGYEVEIPLTVTPGVAPDLIFKHGEQVLGVEVERALAGDDPQKWQAIAQARETVAVVVPDRETSERVRVYLERAGIGRFLLTDFSYLVQQQPKSPDEFWQVRKGLPDA